MAQCDNPPLFLGIDGGGTKCKVQLEDSNGQCLAQGIGGPANLVRSLSDTIESILSATHDALAQAQLSPKVMSRIIAVAGVAGANVSVFKQALAQWQHPFAHLMVTTDMHIACVGAHHHDDGGVIILGTGFCAGIKINDQIEEIGGHGLYLGDQASGASLGLQAIQRSLQVLDGVIPATAFSDQLLRHLDSQTAEKLVSTTLSAQPSFYGQLAPLVFDFARQDDPIALNIVQTAADYIHWYAERILASSTNRLSLIGGIAGEIVPWLEHGLQAKLSVAKSTPEAGALLLARTTSSALAR